MKPHVNEIIYFTHSVFCKPQLVDIIKLFKTDAVNSKLVIVDVHKKTISSILSNTDKITVINSIETIDLLINNCEVTSYPRFCIHRNNKCLESISGNYDNIISILKYYF